MAVAVELGARPATGHGDRLLGVVQHMAEAYAQAASEEAIAYAKAVNHPASLAFALWTSPVVASVRRESPVVAERSTALIELSLEQRLTFFEDVRIEDSRHKRLELT